MNNTLHAITGNWVCGAIIALALACYYALALRTLNPQSEDRGAHIAVLIGALPLGGLFGTITGLLQCFGAMAAGEGGEAITSGIGAALFTTQLGLVCAVPAWLWQSWLNGRAPVTAEGAERVVAS